MRPIKIKQVPTKGAPCPLITRIGKNTLIGALVNKNRPSIEGSYKVRPPEQVFMDIRADTNAMSIMPEHTNSVKYLTEKYLSAFNYACCPREPTSQGLELTLSKTIFSKGTLKFLLQEEKLLRKAESH